MADAILSVSNKEGIGDFASGLSDLGWNIYATEGTASEIDGSHVNGNFVDLLRNYPPYGNLANGVGREQQASLLAGIVLASGEVDPPDETANIGLVCVNMRKINLNLEPDQLPFPEVDFGGPFLLHAAVRSRRITVSSPRYYNFVLDWLRADRPNESFFLDHLASKTENNIARYTGDLHLRIDKMKRPYDLMTPSEPTS